MTAGTAMPIARSVLSCSCAIAIFVTEAAAQAPCPRDGWTAEALTGSAWSLSLPLVVQLPDQDVRLRARYSTRPFADSPYYSYRFGRSTSDGRGVEVEMLHHKLYLENPRPPIERFEVTHGYNLPMANAVGPGHGWQWRFGIGVVIAHPEGVIAGRDVGGSPTLFGGGYHLAGITAQIATGRRYALGTGRSSLTAGPEGKLTASWARMSIGSMRLHVPNVALHLLGGLGAYWCRA